MGSNNVGEICKELHLVDANKSLIEVFSLMKVYRGKMMMVDGRARVEGWAEAVTI